MDYTHQMLDDELAEDAEMLQNDAAFAAQLQRQFDDEDLLTAQMSTSFNFVNSTHLTSQIPNSGPSTSRNPRNDEEIARRLQRKFYLDMKRQGFSDVDLASMLDTLTPDSEYQNAVRASLGEMIEPPVVQSSQSCVEKYLLTLYNNSRYDFNAERPPPESDEFTEFRSQVVNSVRELADVSIMGTSSVLQTIMDNVLATPREWDEIEAAFFIIGAVADRLNSFVNVEAGNKLIQIITHIPHSSHVILLCTTAKLICDLFYWLYCNQSEVVSCVRWLLSLPPYETLLPSISNALEKICLIGHPELFSSFANIRDFLPYVELSTDRGEEMEQCAQCLIRSCVSILNDRKVYQIVHGLSILLSQPMEILQKLIDGSIQPNSDHPPESWHFLATNPVLWLNRLNCIFHTLKDWKLQKAFFKSMDTSIDSPPPWNDLCLQTGQKILETVSAFKNNFEIVECGCKTLMTVINTDRRNMCNLIRDVLRVISQIYNERPEVNLLRLIASTVDEYSIGLDMEETFAEVLNILCIRTCNFCPDVNRTREHVSLMKHLFTVVNTFTRMRFVHFVVQPACENMLETAIGALQVEDEDLQLDAKTFILMIIQFRRNRPTSLPSERAMERIMALFNRFGRELAIKLLTIGLSEPSESLMSSVSTILNEFIRFDPEKSSEFIAECVQQMNNVTNDQRNLFQSQLLNCNESYEVANLLIDFSRAFSNHQ